MSGMRWMIALFSMLLLIFISPVSAAAEGATIVVNDASAQYGDTIQIPIDIRNAKDIGSLDVSLRYDTDVLALREAETGNLTQNSVIQWNIKGDKGLIGIIHGEGINGNGSLAILTFNVLGSPGSTSVLDLDVSAYNVSAFSVVELTTKNGLVTVMGGAAKPTATPTRAAGSSGSGVITTPAKRDGLEPLVIGIEKVYAYQNSTIEVPIVMHNASDVGSVEFYLHGNASVLNVSDVSKSELTANSLLQWSSNESNLKILVIDAAGINGHGALVYLTVTVVGAPCSMSKLNLSGLEISNAASMDEIPATIHNGTLVVKSAVDNETSSEDNKTIKDMVVPAQKTPLTTPAQEQEPDEATPGFDAPISALAITLLAIVCMRRMRQK